MKNKIKVVITGLIYPMTMLHWFWRAFERREDVDLFVAGPFSDNRIPWNFGMDLPKKYVKMPNLPLPENARNIPSKFIQMQLPWKPDLWLEIDAGWHLADKPEATVVAHIQTDPHVLKGFYQQIIGRSDIEYCMQMCYMDQGEWYLPYAADETVLRPLDIPKEYDACLIGLHYDQRNDLVRKIKDKGHSVYYSLGEIYDDYNLKYNQSRTALSWSTLDDTPCRVFEAMAMGIPLVTNRTPDLSNFFVDGEHYLGFSNVNEGVKQVEKFLNEPDYAANVAGNAYRKVLAGHTWGHRVQQILEQAKLV